MKKQKIYQKQFDEKTQKHFPFGKRIQKKIVFKKSFSFFEIWKKLKSYQTRSFFKKQFFRIGFWIFFGILLLIFFPKINSSAEKYAQKKYFIPRGITLFVSNNQNLIQNGSPEFPFSEIKPALELAKKNSSFRFIQIDKGVYEIKETLSIPHQKNLIGKESPIIKKITENGRVIFFEGDGIIEGFKIENGRYGIYISSQSKKITIKNCQISKAEFFGIYNEINNVDQKELHLNISHCHIFENKKQGIYLQNGFFEIKNCLVEKNGEEGIDHHGNYTSLIENTTISQNGEGGIETELDRSFLTIKNSTVTKNQNSGINFQSKSSELSEISIIDNLIENNGKFGIRCAVHGAISSLYFKKMFNPKDTMKNNIFKNNGTGDIDQNCFIF